MTTLIELMGTIRKLSRQDRVDLARWFHREPLEDGELRVEEPSAVYGALQQRMSVEEYMALEERQQTKHEYVAGEIFAMTGVSRQHNRITGNLYNVFSTHLRGKSCEVFMAEFKLRFQAGRDEFVYYPDLMVSCRPESIHQYYLSDPTIVIEVLSPSTERTDRREKLQSCSQIESLEEFVLVAQSREELIFHRRVDEWKPEVIGGAGAMAEFRSLDLVVPMARVYDGVQQAAAG